MTDDPKKDDESPEGDGKDPFGRPLDTHAPVIVSEEDLPRLVAERDAEESDEDESAEDDLSDLKEVEEVLTAGEGREDDLVSMMGR